MAVCGSLEVQISSVLETLTRTAVQEICKLIHTEHLEMRLEIRKGHNQIQTLRGKVQDLRRELKKPSLSPLGLIESQHRRDGGVSDLHQESHFQETDRCMKVNTLRRGTEASPSCMFSRPDRGVTCREPRILNDPLPAEERAVELKVEPAGHRVAPCQFEICQGDSGQCPSSCMSGGDGDHYGTAEFHPQSPYHPEQLPGPGQGPDFKYDPPVSLPGGSVSRARATPGGVSFKTESEEEPLTKTTNEAEPCPAIDGDAFPWPSLASVSFEVNPGVPGCSSMLHRRAPPSHADPRAFDPDTPPPKGPPPRLPVMLGPRGLPRAHGHLRPFSCPFCPKSFLSTTDLTRHQRIHTGEKPFGCSICGKRFSLRGNLVTHERAHSGSKPFICRHCGRAFSHGSNLRAHQRIHTGEKPFRCSVCGMTFAWYYPFKRHMGLHCANGTDS